MNKQRQITSVPINPNTPTANGVIESIHKTIGQVVQVYCHLKPPQNAQEAECTVQQAFAQAMHVIVVEKLCRRG